MTSLRVSNKEKYEKQCYGKRCCVDCHHCYIGTHAFMAGIQGSFVLVVCLLAAFLGDHKVADIAYIGDEINNIHNIESINVVEDANTPGSKKIITNYNDDAQTRFSFTFVRFSYYFNGAVFLALGVVAAIIAGKRWRDVGSTLWVVYFVILGSMFISTIFDVVQLFRVLLCAFGEGASKDQEVQQKVEVQHDGHERIRYVKNQNIQNTPQGQGYENELIQKANGSESEVPAQLYIHIVTRFTWIIIELIMFVLAALAVVRGKKERQLLPDEDEAEAQSDSETTEITVIIDMNRGQPHSLSSVTDTDTVSVSVDSILEQKEKQEQQKQQQHYQYEQQEQDQQEREQLQVQVGSTSTSSTSSIVSNPVTQYLNQPQPLAYNFNYNREQPIAYGNGQGQAQAQDYQYQPQAQQPYPATTIQQEQAQQEQALAHSSSDVMQR